MSKRLKGRTTLPDGNDVIIEDISLIVEMIARTAQWVHPETFRSLPVWSPWIGRGYPIYDASWQRQITNTNQTSKVAIPKVEANVVAASDLRSALGLTSAPTNWTTCHVWGYDDQSFSSSATVVKNLRYYSCVGNMVLIPTGLKGFTDTVPLVRAILRTCAFYMYGWTCEDESVRDEAAAIRTGVIPNHYPASWPAPDRPQARPLGTALCTVEIQDKIRTKKDRIRRMLDDPGLTFFPRETVREVLAFWNVDL